MYDLCCFSLAVVIKFLYYTPERREKEATMKCENCGMELEEDQTVCPICNPQQEEPEAPETQSVEPKEAAAEEPVRKTRKQRKKEKILKITLSAVAGVLVVALILGLILTGTNDGWGRANNVFRKVSYASFDLNASLNRNKVVATAGSFELTNGQLQVLYAMQIFDFISVYGEYLQYTDINLDLKKPLSEQIYDEESGLSWEKFFLQEAISEWVQQCAVCQKAKENLYELPKDFADHMATLEETMKESAEKDGFASVNSMLQSDLGVNVTFDDYYNYLTLYYTSSLYIEELMDKVKISLDDLEKYFTENEKDLKENYNITKESGNYIDVRHILIMPEGGTKSDDGKTTIYSDAEWEACRVKAQAVYDEWLAGAKNEDSFAALANEKSEDQNGQVTNGGLYENVTQGAMVEAFDQWCFDAARNPGDHGLVKTEFGYHVMYFVDKEAIWSRYCRSGIQNQEVQKIIVDYAEKLEWKVDFTAIVLDEVKLSN